MSSTKSEPSPSSQVPSTEQMSHLRSSNGANPLMSVYVTAVMGPMKQSYVRSAGSVGVDIYEEAVMQGLSGTHLELSSGMDGSDLKQHVPFRIGPVATSIFNKDHVLVIAPSDLEMLAYQRWAMNVHPIRDLVVYIKLTGFQNMTTIAPYFLSNCSSLAAIDVSPLSNVTSIGSHFLSDCTSLPTIDLRSLSNVTSIGSYFLSNCTSLTAIYMSPLSKVTGICSHFLSNCNSLPTIDLRSLSNVTSIGSSFLYNCYSLAAIDMRSLSKVTSIGRYFLSNGTSLAAIDMRPLSNVTSIDSGFLSNCTSLVHASLPPNIVADSSMFYGCTKLSRTAETDL